MLSVERGFQLKKHLEARLAARIHSLLDRKNEYPPIVHALVGSDQFHLHPSCNDLLSEERVYAQRYGQRGRVDWQIVIEQSFEDAVRAYLRPCSTCEQRAEDEVDELWSSRTQPPEPPPDAEDEEGEGLEIEQPNLALGDVRGTEI